MLSYLQPAHPRVSAETSLVGVRYSKNHPVVTLQRREKKVVFLSFLVYFCKIPPPQTSSRHFLPDGGIQLTGQAVPGMVTSKKSENPVIGLD